MELLGLMSCEQILLVLPYCDGRVSAGFPSPAEDYLESQLDLHDYLIRNKAATFLMRVEGDSMKGAGLFHGDLIVVDRAAEPLSGCIVVVSLNGEHTVKRLRRTPECVWLEPENPSYHPIRVEQDAELHVFGVVLHSIHDLR